MSPAGKNTKEDDADKRSSRQVQAKKAEDMRIWGILIFGIIGATATTFAIGHLRRTFGWFYTQMSRSQSSWKNASGSGPFRTNFQEEAWKRYNRRMQEEYEEELERVERIRRMQSVFNRERNKHRRGYESWNESGSNPYSQNFQRDDWYWKSEASSNTNGRNNHNYRDNRRDFNSTYPLSHHYSVLGLSRSRTKPYTDDEIKTAFRSKVMQFHPDQNQENKVAAEEKFKEVMTSYEAIKSERKNNKQ